jgi:hypothetical protein
LTHDLCGVEVITSEPLPEELGQRLAADQHRIALLFVECVALNAQVGSRVQRA